MIILMCLFIASLGLLLCGDEIAKKNENLQNIQAKLKGIQATLGAVGVIFGFLGFVIGVLSLGNGILVTLTTLGNATMFAAGLPYAMPKIKEVIENKKIVKTLDGWSIKVQENGNTLGMACFVIAILIFAASISLTGPRIYM